MTSKREIPDRIPPTHPHFKAREEMRLRHHTSAVCFLIAITHYGQWLGVYEKSVAKPKDVKPFKDTAPLMIKLKAWGEHFGELSGLQRLDELELPDKPQTSAHIRAAHQGCHKAVLDWISRHYADEVYGQFLHLSLLCWLERMGEEAIQFPANSP